MDFFVRRNGRVAGKPKLGDAQGVRQTEERAHVFAGTDIVGDEVDGAGHRRDHEQESNRHIVEIVRAATENLSPRSYIPDCSPQR